MKIILFLIPLALLSLSYNDLDIYQRTLSYQTAKQRLEKYLIKDATLNQYFTITKDAIAIYAGPDKAELEYTFFFDPDCCLIDPLSASEVVKFKMNDEAKVKTPWRGEKRRNSQQQQAQGVEKVAIRVFGPDRPLPPLMGKKIAIDPGHFGGSYAPLEERLIQIGNFHFNEGTLTLCTALLLKQMLEEAGATVFLTKDKLAEGAINLDFFSWLKAHPEYKDKKRVFHEKYNREDLIARSAAINNFDPDLALTIHYNAYEEETITQKNFNMVFMPGAFCKGELAGKEERIHFLRLLVSPTIPLSIHFSKQVIAHLTTETKVPPATSDLGLSYLTRVCLEVSPGVYCRNLTLTRLVKAPLCYGESLIQNNETELRLLSQIDGEINGIGYPKRIVSVARAYFLTLQSLFDN